MAQTPPVDTNPPDKTPPKPERTPSACRNGWLIGIGSFLAAAILLYLARDLFDQFDEPRDIVILLLPFFIATSVGILVIIAYLKCPEYHKPFMSAEIIDLAMVGIVGGAIYALAIDQQIAQSSVTGIYGAMIGYVLGRVHPSFRGRKQRWSDETQAIEKRVDEPRTSQSGATQ